MPTGIELKISELIVILFTTLGPVKLILPFNSLTEHLSYKDKFKVAVFATVISFIIIAVVVATGPNIVEKWDLSKSAIAVTGGIIIFLQGFSMALKNPAHIDERKVLSNNESFNDKTLLQLAHILVIPAIITPAGIMVILSVTSFHHGDVNSLVLFLIKILATLIILNFVFMVITPFICRFIKSIYIRITGWVFSIFIMILGVHIVIQSITKLVN